MHTSRSVNTKVYVFNIKQDLLISLYIKWYSQAHTELMSDPVWNLISGEVGGKWWQCAVSHNGNTSIAAWVPNTHLIKWHGANGDAL